MSLKNIVAGDYGQVLRLTVYDVDTGEPADLSGYDSEQIIILRDPDGEEHDKTAAFATDGSDGVVEYELADGDIDASGIWEAMVRVESATAQLRSERLSFHVLR